MTAGERQPLTAEQHEEWLTTAWAGATYDDAATARDVLRDNYARVLARAVSAEAALAEALALVRTRRMSLHMDGSEHYSQPVLGELAAILGVALAGSSPAAEAEHADHCAAVTGHGIASRCTCGAASGVSDTREGGRLTPNEDAYFLERGANYASAIGVARLHLKRGKPEEALAALDRAVRESQRKHVDACIADGADPAVAVAIFGGAASPVPAVADDPEPDYNPGLLPDEEGYRPFVANRSGVSPCFMPCGDAACQKLGCVRVYNAEHGGLLDVPANKDTDE